MSTTTDPRWPLLESIISPDDLRQLPRSRLPELAREMRNYLLETVSTTGGHLSAGLGTIELTIALHYVFNTPTDKLVWDVGHQTYPHKILTERRHRMSTLRQNNGLAGFPKRSESEYDAFGTGHSSTSISAALGMSIAAKQNESGYKSVAIIGDGAMTGGMAFEALNHAGDSDADVLVILNDNDMSISPNVGGLSNHLTRLLSGQLYSTVREGGKKVLEHMPSVWELARRTEEHVKGMVAPGTLFEELGFNYFGPVDGHDLGTLVPILQNLYEQKGPRFLHIVTRKGKGYFPAEDDPSRYHGVGKFDTSTGEATGAAESNPTFTRVFSDWLCDMAAEDQRLIGITPAMREGSGLVEFSQQYPDRYFDVGIAEQHAVTLAAGMSCEGLKPVVAIYSTFLQRAYDQLIHDVAIQNLPVLFAIDRAGIVGADGPTHTGAYDISYLRCVPNMVIMTPTDADETRCMLTTGFLHDGPAAVRYPRGSTGSSVHRKKLIAIEFGKAERCREGRRVALLVFGTLLSSAASVADQIDASLYNMRFVKPLDEDVIRQASEKHDLLVTIEENAVAGGAGSAVNEWLAANAKSVNVLNLGFPDAFVGQGTQAEMLSEWGLNTEGMLASIQQRLAMLDASNCQ
ncbi:MAG: 1-deoxy-D-xylulose-5-phosphate synthase [Gammaproteobacteria bacterium]|nr:1-deoxy-D-xylulose-5-phosphate synthase [Gammaproteobacteria bacterium]